MSKKKTGGTFDDDLKEKLITMGGLGYSVTTMAQVLSMTEKEMVELLESGGQELYDHGSAVIKFAMEKKLVEMATKGDLKAMQSVREIIGKNERDKGW